MVKSQISPTPIAQLNISHSLDSLPAVSIGNKLSDQELRYRFENLSLAIQGAS
jgi:hypothetical protein